MVAQSVGAVPFGRGALRSPGESCGATPPSRAPRPPSWRPPRGWRAACAPPRRPSSPASRTSACRGSRPAASAAPCQEKHESLNAHHQCLTRSGDVTHRCSSRSFSARRRIILVLAAANMRHSSSSSLQQTSVWPLQLRNSTVHEQLTSSCAFINSFMRFTSFRCFKLSASSCLASAAWISACDRRVYQEYINSSKISRSDSSYQALLLLRELNRELLELLAFDLSFHAPLVRLLQVVVDSERHNEQLHDCTCTCTYGIAAVQSFQLTARLESAAHLCSSGIVFEPRSDLPRWRPPSSFAAGQPRLGPKIQTSFESKNFSDWPLHSTTRASKQVITCICLSCSLKTLIILYFFFKCPYNFIIKIAIFLNNWKIFIFDIPHLVIRISSIS